MFLGKSLKDGRSQTIKNHILFCREALLKNPNLSYEVQIVADRLQIDRDKLSKALEIAVILHDLGKFSTSWQKSKMKEKKESSTFNIYHGLFSWIIYKNMELDLDKELNDIVGFAIATHHTGPYYLIFSKVEDEKYKNGYERELDEIDIDSINEFLIDFGFKPIKNKLEYFDFQKYKNENKPLKGAKALMSDKKQFGLIRYKLLFSFIRAKLREADHIGSANFENDRRYEDEIKESKKEFLNLKESILKNIKNLRDWQKEYIDEKEAIINFIYADVGMGKTEASLLRILKNSNFARIIWVVPTRFLGSSIYSRFKEDITTSLIFTQSKLYKDEKDSEEIDVYEKFDKKFISPLIITTIDQLLYSFVNHSDKSMDILGNVASSVVVLDETHSYDSYTESGVIDLIEILAESKIQTHILTATLTKELNSNLSKIYDKFENDIVKKRVKDERVKSSYIVDKEAIFLNDSVNPKVINLLKNIDSSDRVIIYLNTINKILKFKEAIKELPANIYIYHSEFKFEDKPDIETALLEIFDKNQDSEVKGIYNNHDSKKPTILIMNQIGILGIDLKKCSLMISEIAPWQIVMQQNGRLNRNGSYESSKHYIFGTSGDEKYYMPYLTKKEFELSKDRVEEYYESILNIFASNDRVYYENFLEINGIYEEENSHFKKEVLADSYFGSQESSFSARIIANQKVKVITVEDENEIEDKREIDKYFVEVNRGRIEEAKKRGIGFKLKEYYYITDAKYSIEEGFDFFKIDFDGDEI